MVEKLLTFNLHNFLWSVSAKCLASFSQESLRNRALGVSFNHFFGLSITSNSSTAFQSFFRDLWEGRVFYQWRKCSKSWKMMREKWEIKDSRWASHCSALEAYIFPITLVPFRNLDMLILLRIRRNGSSMTSIQKHACNIFALNDKMYFHSSIH